MCPTSLPECSYRSELAQYHQVQQKSLQGDTWCVRAAEFLLGCDGMVSYSEKWRACLRHPKLLRCPSASHVERASATPPRLGPCAFCLCRFVQLLSTPTRLERFLRLGDVNDRSADDEEQDQGQGSQGQPKQEEHQEQQGEQEQEEQQEEQAATE